MDMPFAQYLGTSSKSRCHLRVENHDSFAEQSPTILALSEVVGKTQKYPHGIV